jgi:hypothetical protein
MLRELEHVALALAKRREMDVEHLDAKVQILAELTRAHGLIEIAVRRRDDARVEQDLARSAERPHPALLKNPEQLRLQVERHVADFVEKQRPASRLLEQADARVNGTREGALLVPEQLGLENFVGNSGTAHRNERAARALARLVDGASN